MKRTTLITTTVFAAILLVAAFYVYILFGGRSAVNRYLAATAEGRELPSDILVDEQGFSVRMRERGRLAELLRAGYRIDHSADTWMFRAITGSMHSVRTTPDIGLICEVYKDGHWKLFCGQLRCATGDPCIFRNADGDEYKLSLPE